MAHFCLFRASAGGFANDTRLSGMAVAIINSIKLINAGMQADPMNERLRSLALALNDPDWKARTSAYEQVHNLVGSQASQVLAIICDHIPKILSEITPLALEKGLHLVQICLLHADNHMSFAPNWNSILRSLFEKVCSQGKPTYQKICEDIFTKSGERLGWKETWIVTKECLNSKNPKIQVGTLNTIKWINKAGWIEECALHANILAEKCQDSNPVVRGAALDFLKNLVLHKGTALLKAIPGLKPNQYSMLASFMETSKTQNQLVDKAQSQSIDKPEAIPIDNWDTQEQVSVLAKFPETWSQRVEQEPNWADKKKKLEILDAALGFGLKYEPAPYMHLARLLKKTLSEANVPLHMVCLSIARKLASGFRSRFAQGFKYLNRTLLFKLRDRKPAVTEAVIYILKSGTYCVNLEEVLDDYREILRDKNTQVRATILKVLCYYITHPNSKVSNQGIVRNLLNISKEGIADVAVEVKKGSFELLGSLAKLGSSEPNLAKELADLEQKFREQIRDSFRLKPAAAGPGPKSIQTPSHSQDPSKPHDTLLSSPLTVKQTLMATDRKVQSAEKSRVGTADLETMKSIVGLERASKLLSNQNTPTQSKPALYPLHRLSGQERSDLGTAKNTSPLPKQFNSPVFKKPNTLAHGLSPKSPFPRQPASNQPVKRNMSTSEMKLSLLLQQHSKDQPSQPKPQINLSMAQVVNLEDEGDSPLISIVKPDSNMQLQMNSEPIDHQLKQAIKIESLDPEGCHKLPKVNSEEISTSSMVSISQQGGAAQSFKPSGGLQTGQALAQSTRNGAHNESNSSKEPTLNLDAVALQPEIVAPAMQSIESILEEIKVDMDLGSALNCIIENYGYNADFWVRISTGTSKSRAEQMAQLRRSYEIKYNATSAQAVMLVASLATDRFRETNLLLFEEVVQLSNVVIGHLYSKSAHIVVELVIERFESLIGETLDRLDHKKALPEIQLITSMATKLNIRKLALMILLNLKDKASPTATEVGMLLLRHIIFKNWGSPQLLTLLPLREISALLKGSIKNVNPRVRQSGLDLLAWLCKANLKEESLIQLENQVAQQNLKEYQDACRLVLLLTGSGQQGLTQLDMSSETDMSSLTIPVQAQAIVNQIPVEAEPKEAAVSATPQINPEIPKQAHEVMVPPAAPFEARDKLLLPAKTLRKVNPGTKQLREQELAKVSDGENEQKLSEQTAPVAIAGTVPEISGVQSADRIRLELRDNELAHLKIVLKTEYGEAFMTQMFSVESKRVAEVLAKVESRLKQKQEGDKDTWLHFLLWLLYRVSDSCNSELLEQFAASVLRLIHFADRQAKSLKSEEAQLLIAVILRVVSNQESSTGVQLFSATFNYLLLQEHLELFNSTSVSALCKPGVRCKDRVLQLVYLFNKNSKLAMTLATFFKFVGVLEYLPKSTLKEGCQTIKLMLSLLSVQDEASVLQLAKTQGFSMRLMELWSNIISPYPFDDCTNNKPPARQLAESSVQTEMLIENRHVDVGVDPVEETQIDRMQEEPIPPVQLQLGPYDPNEPPLIMFCRPLLQLREEIEEILAACDLITEHEVKDQNLGPPLCWPVTILVLKKILDVSKLKTVESESFINDSSKLIRKFLCAILKFIAVDNPRSSVLQEKLKLGTELLQKLCGCFTFTSSLEIEDFIELYANLSQSLIDIKLKFNMEELKQSNSTFGSQVAEPQMIRKLLNSALLRLLDTNPSILLPSLLQFLSMQEPNCALEGIVLKSLLQFSQGMSAVLQKVSCIKILDYVDLHLKTVDGKVSSTRKQMLKTIVNNVWIASGGSEGECLLWEGTGQLAEWICSLKELHQTEVHEEQAPEEMAPEEPKTSDLIANSVPWEQTNKSMNVEALPVLSLLGRPPLTVTQPLAEVDYKMIAEAPESMNIRQTRSKTRDLNIFTKRSHQNSPVDADQNAIESHLHEKHKELTSFLPHQTESPLPNLLQSLENTRGKGEYEMAFHQSSQNMNKAREQDQLEEISETSHIAIRAGLLPSRTKQSSPSGDRPRVPVSPLGMVQKLSNGLAASTQQLIDANYLISLTDGRQVQASKIVAPAQAYCSKNSCSKKEIVPPNKPETPVIPLPLLFGSNSKSPSLNPVFQGMIKSYSQATLTHYKDHASIIAGYLKRDFPTNTPEDDGIAPYLEDLSAGQRSYLFSYLESVGLQKWIPTAAAQSRHQSSGKKSTCSKHKSGSPGQAAPTPISKIFSQLAIINERLDLARPKDSKGSELSKPLTSSNLGILGLGRTSNFPLVATQSPPEALASSRDQPEEREDRINQLESQIQAVLKRLQPLPQK